jgi:N-acetylneuraminic acid mutarotase
VNGKTGTSNSDFIVTAASANSWTATGSMNEARDGHTATLLPNGKLLVVGGTKRLGDGTNSTLGTCELYDPTTENWTATGSLNAADFRAYHTATLLQNGKVLITGGFVENTQTILASSALYDPGTGQWTSTGALTEKRVYHTATLLNNGKVLVTGGNGSLCELYDPATGQWTAGGSLNALHSQHTATLLNNGNVLIAGGAQGNGASATCELYDPGNNTWSLAAAMPQGHGDHTAVLLPNGIVLVVGGIGYQASGYLAYDPANQWVDRGSAFYQRINHTSTLLPSGTVLTAGGQALGTQFSGAINAAELYNTATNIASLAAGMTVARTYHTATLLANGKVLVTGGFHNGPQGYIISASESELYTP